MKVDLDSILWIVISLVILIVSGINSVRKKKARQMQQTGQKGEETYDQYDTESAEQPPAEPVSTDPFTRLEQFLIGNTQSDQGTSYPQTDSSVAESRVVSLEGESLETIVDEEELLLAEQAANREGLGDVPVEEIAEIYVPGLADGLYVDHDQTTDESGLFTDEDEIRRAIIYNEIFQRRF